MEPEVTFNASIRSGAYANFTAIYSPVCFDAYRVWNCKFRFPECTVNELGIVVEKRMCKSSCLDYHNRCDTTIGNVNKDFLGTPNCTNWPEFATVNGTTTCFSNVVPVAQQSMIRVCPAPLIEPPAGSYDYIADGNVTDGFTPAKIVGKNGADFDIDQTVCYPNLGCCLPCQSAEYFYPFQYFSSLRIASVVMRAASFVLAIFVTVTYAVVPDNRTHPKVIVLYLSVAVTAYQFFTLVPVIFGNRVLCKDEITRATQSTNWVCGTSGALTMYSAMISLTWVTAFIVNFHMQTVWNSSAMGKYYPFIHLACWGIPLPIVAFTLYKKAIMYQNLGYQCFVAVDRINAYFFLPMAVLFVPDLLLQLWTTAWLISQKRRERRAERAHEARVAAVAAARMQVSNVSIHTDRKSLQPDPNQRTPTPQQHSPHSTTAPSSYPPRPAPITRDEPEVQNDFSNRMSYNLRSMSSTTLSAQLIRPSNSPSRAASFTSESVPGYPGLPVNRSGTDYPVAVIAPPSVPNSAPPTPPRVQLVGALSVTWRMFLLIFAAVVTPTWFWVFFNWDAPTLINNLRQSTPENVLLKQWLFCVFASPSGSSASCSPSNLPLFFRFVGLEAATAFPGIILFIVFGARMEMWKVWRNWREDRKERRRTRISGRRRRGDGLFGRVREQLSSFRQWASGLTRKKNDEFEGF
ncbi:hypothetical protein BJ742DRAFT_549640 [Cladochytrium replicatum]|nr:hypothetical protein BJ742DRAFT_549640 [Cladochytrium replicatum]